MPDKNASSKSTNGVGEIKVLITAGAMAATLAGWAALASEASGVAEKPVPTPPPGLPASLQFLKDPLPTLVPPAVQFGQAPTGEAAEPSLRTVSAPPPVQIVTITQNDSSSPKSPARTSSSR
jgi:hypothetical protein